MYFPNEIHVFFLLKIRMRLKLETIFFLCSSEQEILLKLNEVPCVKLIHICLAEQHNEVEDIYAPLQRLNQPYDIRWLRLKGFKPVRYLVQVTLTMRCLFCSTTLKFLINMKSRLPILKNSTLQKKKIHPPRLLIS